MTLNRLFLIGLAAIALGWIGLYVVDLRERADDKAFYERKVAPALAVTGAFDRAAMDEWLERTKRRSNNAATRFYLFEGGLLLTVAWGAVGTIRGELSWKRRNAADRMADANAGEVIRDLRGLGGPFVARSSNRWLFSTAGPGEVEVDPAAETVIFRGLTFRRYFAGNRSTPQTVLRFEDILGGRIWSNHGRYSLNLRTTAGTVTISDAVKPFQELVTILLDVAEANRARPERYAQALAREPHIKTPWYGWLLLAAGLAAVAGISIALWNLPGK